MIKEVSIRHLYNKKVPTIFAHDSVDNAVKILEDTRSSAVVILDEASLPIGILTERDIAKKAAHWDKIILSPVGEIMSSPLLSVNEDTDFRDAYMQMSENGFRHLIVVNGENTLAGILSENDFLQNLTPEHLLSVKEVRLVMSKEVVTTSQDQTVSQTITLMTWNKISSIVILHEGKPVGLFTERDAVHLARNGYKALSAPIHEHMSSPVITINENDSVMDAEHIFKDEQIRHLIVVDNKGHLTGILAQHDLVKGISGIYIEMLRDTIRTQSNVLHDTYNCLEEQSVLNNILNSFSDKLIIACDKKNIVQFTNSTNFQCLNTTLRKGDLLDENIKCFDTTFAAATLNADINTITNHNSVVIGNNGAEYFFKTTYAPIYSAENIIQGFLFTAEDITAEKNAYNNLQQTKEKLEKSEIRFRKIFENAKDGILLANIETKMFYLGNQASYDMLGYTKEEIKTLGVMDIHPKESLPFIAEEFDKQKRREKITSYDIPILRKNGSVLYVDISTEVIELDGNNFMLGVFHDITEKKENKKLLEEEKEKLRLFIEHAPAALAMFDLQMRYIAISNRWLTDYGFENKDFIGQSHYEIFPEIPQDWKDAHKRGLSGEVIHKESDKFKRADGTIQWLKWEIRPWKKADNTIGGIVIFTEDITDRKKAQEELTASYNLMTTIIDTAPLRIYWKDTNLNYLGCNTAFAKDAGKLSSDDIIGTNDYLLSWKNQAELYRTDDRSVIDSNTPKLSLEEQQTLPDGETVWLRTSKVPLHNKKNETIGILGVYEDITEKKAIEIKLREQEELIILQSRYAAMGEMIGMIAHQWRQPLTVISMDANNMLLDIALDDFDVTKAKRYSNHVLTQTQHLSKTIDDFRNFFKPEKSASKVKLQEVLEETYTIIKTSLANNNIELKSSYASELEISVYPRELMQVFVNIINNAKDSLLLKKGENPLIEIKVYEDEHYVITTICDNGGGIDEAILDKVFNPYFSTKDEKNGTGLGLYMSKMIIEEHLHGKIEAYNKEDGACFIIKLRKNEDEIG